MRSQLDTAMRKINNYKEELTQKKAQNANLEEEIENLRIELEQAKIMAASNQSKIEDSLQLNESVAELRAENKELLDRL